MGAWIEIYVVTDPKGEIVVAPLVGGGSRPESFAGIDNQIVLDVIKGENIDIIADSEFFDKGRYNELIKKGAFTDLYAFLDSDKEFGRDSFLKIFWN